MADLTTKGRKRIKASNFGLPAQRAYPVNDKPHARNAKARAAQQLKAGNLTPAEKAQIDRKADKVLGTNKKK